MKFRFAFLGTLAGILLFTACQFKSDETAQVELASESEAELTQGLAASFMSDGQSFSYTLHYDGALMQIVDGQFEGAGVVGPSFSVLGGAQIVVKTESAAAVLELPAMTEPAQDVNGLTVYHGSEFEENCTLDTSVIPVSAESLVMTLKTCDGQDVQAGRQAFFSLLDGLEVKAL